MKCLLIVILLISFSLSANSVDTIHSRLYSDVMASSKYVDGKVDSIRNLLLSDGSFSNVTYSTTGSGGENHLSMLHLLAKAYAEPTSSFYQNGSLKSDIYQAIEYWVNLDLQNSNWWIRYVSYPQKFGPVITIMGSQLEQDKPILFTKSIDYQAWAWYFGDESHKTGANLLDIGYVTLFAAVGSKNTSLMHDVISRCEGEISFAQKDGLHADWSYSQHTGIGLQLYSGTYGGEFAKRATTIAALCRETDFSFSQTSMNSLENFLLEGVQWMSFGKRVDYNAIGRKIGLPSGINSAKTFLGPINNLITCGSQRVEELQRWKARINADSAGGPIGNRSFWRHDFSVQRGQNWYASVRCNSTRVVGSESGNGQGIRNYHMGDGVLMHSTESSTYGDIFPLWDWHQIPGITAEQHGDNFPLVNWGKGALGGSNHVGTVSNGSIGFSCMELNRDGVKGKKGWFLSNEAIVALGAGISSSNGNPIVTTIEQNLFASKVTVVGGGSYTSGSKNLTAGSRLFHRGSLYESLDNTTLLKMNIEKRTGSWRTINTGASTETFSRDVFSLTTDHGTKPQNGSYAYGIIPMAPDSFKNSATEFPAEIIKNSDSLQVAYLPSQNIYGGIFYKSGSFMASTGSEFQSKSTALYLIQYRDDSVVVSLSDPTQTQSSITFAIDGYYAHKYGRYNETTQKTEVTVTLPTGMYRGSTVSLILTTPSISLTSPIGSQVYTYGDTLKVSWNHAIDSTVAVGLTLNKSWIKTISVGDPDVSVGNITWVIPETLEESDRYGISIVSKKYPEIKDVTDTFFSIVKNGINVNEHPLGVTFLKIDAIDAGRISLSIPQTGLYTLKIHNMLGRELLNRKYQLSKGNHILETENFSHSILFVTIEGMGKSLFRKTVLR